MKLAFITPRMIVGGAETYIIRKSRWLIEHGYSVIVISSGGDFTRALPMEVKHFDLNVSVAPYTLSYKVQEETVRSLTQILLDEKIDIIEAHNAFPIMYVAMSYRYHRIPFVLNVLLELDYDRDWLLRMITCMLSKKGLYCTLTTSMNEYIEKKCHSKLSPIILPIPISTTDNIMNTCDDYFLTVGRLSEDKMYVKSVIQDFGQLIQNHPELETIKLLVVGDGALKAEVAAIAKAVNENFEEERVRLLGTVVDGELEKLYENCLAYIGVGTTMLIGASYRKPVILATGFQDNQSYAYGFWGEHPDIDRHLIGGGADCINDRRSSFYNMMWEVIADEKLRDRVANMAFKLFKDTYDMDSIMDKWNLVYRDKAQFPFNKSIELFGQIVLRSSYIILHLAYSLYKTVKMSKRA